MSLLATVFAFSVTLLPLVPAMAQGQPPAQSPPASALPASPNAQRPRSSAAIDYLRSQGVELVSLGEIAGGLQGYLGEAVGGRHQVFYITPDGETVIAGIAFDARGTNVTGAQIEAMKRRADAERARLDEDRRRAEEAARSAAERARQNESRARDLESARSQFSGSFESSGPQGAARPAQPSAPPPPAPSPTPPVAAPAPAPAVPEVPSSRPAAPPAPAPTPSPSPASADRFVSPLNQSEVMGAAEVLPWIRLGRENAPTIYMMADPQCPFCHATWAALRPRIVAGDLSVRLILVGALPGSRERVISILARGDDAGRAWLRGEGSTQDTPVAPPPARDSERFQQAEGFANANAAFAIRFNLEQTPWLAYRGADGRLYSKFGANDLNEFLGNLPPRQPAR